MISFGYNQIKRISAVYVSLPLFVFLIGFLKPVFSVPACLLLVAVLVFVLRKDNTDPSRAEKICFSWKELLLLFAIMLLWGYLGGMNGFFFQSSDWGIRNAVYRDLLTKRWPVVYASKLTALDYYIGHWLVPAAVAKPFYYVFGMRVGWFVARMLLWGWTALATFLVTLHLMLYVGAADRRRKILCLIGFIGFSGMDAIGALCVGKWDYVTSPEVLHFEWWNKYQFSSMTTCHYWVFNQSVIPWLVLLCVLSEKNPRNYVFWGCACLLCGPFPFVGLLVLMFVKAGAFLVRQLRQHGGKEALAAFFSVPNLLVFVSVLPIVAVFFFSNNAVGAGLKISAGKAVENAVGLFAAFGTSFLTYLQKFFLVFVLDVGVYLCLLFPRRRRDPLFYAAAASLFFLPFFKIGASSDFAMRATIPAVFLVMVFCVEEAIYLTEHWRESGCLKKLRGAALLLVFLIGLMTPGMEIYRGIYNVCVNGTVRLENKEVKTLENTEISLNFETTDFYEKPFFKYLAKSPRTDSLSAVPGEGFYEEEKLGKKAAESKFRWAKENRAEILLFNGYSAPKSATLELVFGLKEEIKEPFTVTVSIGEQTYTYEISKAAQTVSVPVTLDKMLTAVSLTSSREKTELQEKKETRTVYFSVSGFRLYDENGTLQAGKKPQKPKLESPAAQLDG